MIKLFEMFAGYGGASFALKKAGIPFKCVGYSEIDKYAVQCYEQNHCIVAGWKRIYHPDNYGDATKIDPSSIPDFDLLTGGFPCQAFSVAGKGLGELDTRGTLFNEIIRIAEVKKPKYMLLENVKGLTNKKHKATFDKILSELDRIGYHVKYQV
jgi:DNA (cytosine-5)-methyltransferase 1